MDWNLFFIILGAVEMTRDIFKLIDLIEGETK